MEHITDKYSIYNGDCCQLIKQIPDNSIHFNIFSPPFANLYIYSDNIADMGNCKNKDDFFEQFDYLIPELLRVTVPGRLCAVHCKQLPKYKSRDGQSGIIDFRGDIIRHFEKAGWQYHSEVCIWTDPVLEMQKTKPQGLLYCQTKRDSTYSRQGMAEYLLIFRKWSEDAPLQPVIKTEDEWPLEMWQRYASPVWFDIRRTDVLNGRKARGEKDEKHICPLQLEVIRRSIQLWTNKGDVVFSPFAGVGSELYVAVEQGRKALGFELKESYFKQIIKNIESLGDLDNAIPGQMTLDDLGG